MEQWERWNQNIAKHPFHTSFQPFKTKMRITSSYGKAIPKWFRPDLQNNTLLRHILFRRTKNMNTFIGCVGGVRTSKSYFCLKYAEDYTKECGKEFSVKDQCSFDILHFLKWSKEAKDSAYTLDEIQLQMSPREWFDIQHKVFNAFCDIQGLRRNILLLPFPNISFIDKHLRFLLNYIARTISQGKVVWFKVMTRHELGKSWLQRIGTIRFNLPSQKTIEEYETIKKVFTDSQLDSNINLLQRYGEPSEREQLKLEYLQLRNITMRQRIERWKNKSVTGWSQ